MRLVTVGLAMLALVEGAAAADFEPYLRGSIGDGLARANTGWGGFYAGIQAGYASSGIDFSHSSSAMVSVTGTIHIVSLSSPASNKRLISSLIHGATSVAPPTKV